MAHGGHTRWNPCNITKAGMKTKWVEARNFATINHPKTGGLPYNALTMRFDMELMVKN